MLSTVALAERLNYTRLSVRTYLQSVAITEQRVPTALYVGFWHEHEASLQVKLASSAAWTYSAPMHCKPLPSYHA